MSTKTDPLLIAAFAVFGYMMLNRRAAAATAGGTVLPSRAPTSLPGSVGIGTAQAVGGALGYIFQQIPQWLNSGGGGPTPIASNVPPVLQDSVPLTGDSVDTDPFSDWFQGMA